MYSRIIFLMMGVFLLLGCASKPEPKTFQLNVQVVRAGLKTPLSGVNIEVKKLEPAGVFRRRTVGRQKSAAAGWAAFQLPAGKYRILPSGDYLGQAEVDLQKDEEVTLTVIPIQSQ